MKDKWWAWGSWGKTDVRIRTINDVLDRTILENTAFKTNVQASEAVRANFTFFSGNKKKFGRDASPLVAPESTVDQDGPTKTYKGEVNWIPGNNLFVTARGAYVDAPFSLEPKGGRTTQVFIDANGFQSGSSYYLVTDRPQKTINVDANWFRGRHEVRFGGAWRRVDDVTDFSWGGGVINFEVPDLGPGGYIMAIFRPYIQENFANYNYLYANDTITWNRLTLNVGLRFDHTTNSVREGDVPAHQLVPDLMPAYTSPALDNVVTWNSVSPRFGLSYALDEKRKTIRSSELRVVREPAPGGYGRHGRGQLVRLRVLHRHRRQSRRADRTQRGRARPESGPSASTPTTRRQPSTRSTRISRPRGPTRS